MPKNKMNIPEVLRKYKLKDFELTCIAIYLATKSKSFAWTNTIGIKSKSPNKSIIANQWFSRDNIKQLIYDEELKEITVVEKIVEKIVEKKVDRIDAPPPPIMIQSPIKQEETKIKIADKYGIIDDINKENIKSIYINELNNSDNPEKRADLILKLSDKLELFAAVEENLSKPTIYLPERPE